MEIDEKKDFLPKKINNDTIPSISQKEINEITKNSELKSTPILTEKIEDKLINLPYWEKEKLKSYSLNELKKVSIKQFNQLYNKLTHKIPSQIWISPSEVINPQEISSQNKEEKSQIPEKLIPPKETTELYLQKQDSSILDPEEQRIYGELYIYHVLSSKAPLLEKNPTIWALQSTFLKVKNDYLKTKYQQTRAMRNFNPWNLKTNGDNGRDKWNYAIFSSLEKGRKALIVAIERRKKGESKIYQPSFTLIQFFTKYADPKGAINYAIKAAQIINKLTGLKIIPNKTPIKNIPTEAFATAIAAKEDGNCYKALKNEGLIE